MANYPHTGERALEKAGREKKRNRYLIVRGAEEELLLY